MRKVAAVLVALAAVVAFTDYSFRTSAQGNSAAGRWAITHAPAANNQATIARAAESGKRHIAECISANLAAGAAAPTAVTLTVHLRDGATGAGTPLQSFAISLPATAGATAPPIQLCGLNAAGSINTAMTLEFSATGGANTVQSVALKGRTE